MKCDTCTGELGRSRRCRNCAEARRAMFLDRAGIPVDGSDGDLEFWRETLWTAADSVGLKLTDDQLEAAGRRRS